MFYYLSILLITGFIIDMGPKIKEQVIFFLNINIVYPFVNFVDVFESILFISYSRHDTYKDVNAHIILCYSFITYKECNLL